jgi:excinuclease UvrABC nuclease subunit
VVSSIVKTLPNKPGVYRMLDDSGNVLYVGKAKNLRNRVSSYLRVSGQLICVDGGQNLQAIKKTEEIDQ